MKGKIRLVFLVFIFLQWGISDCHSYTSFDDFLDGDWKPAEILVDQQRRVRRGSPSGLFDETERDIKIISGENEIDIKLQPASDSSTLEHVVVKDGELSKEVPISQNEECNWRGYVQGGGKAVISNCDSPDAYTGTIITAEGLWMLRPETNLDNATRQRRSSRRGQIIIHLILPPSSTENHIAELASNSDVARVPLPQLERAARLAAHDASRRSNDLALSQSEESEESIEDSSDYAPYFPNWFDWNYNYDYYDDFPSRRHANSALLDRKSRTLDAKKKWVEMAVFTDETMYQRVQKKFPNDTIAKIKDYATTLVNTMDLLYGDQTLGIDIGFKLVHLEVMKKTPKNLSSNDGKAKAYLSSFCDYAGNQNVNSGKWDHALLLTGIDLHQEGLKSTAGLAWAGTMCYRYFSCSVAEGYSFGSAFIITHEIGHSLGMEHDGIGVSETCDKDKYIMSPTTGAGKVKWSNCSGKNLQDFMEYGTSELRSKKYQKDMLSKPICLSQLASKGKGSSTKGNKLPGETYDAYFQCALGLGSDFKPYFQRSKAPFNNICWILYCGNGTHAVSTHPALEGTKCDKDKYCKGGQCLKKTGR